MYSTCIYGMLFLSDAARRDCALLRETNEAERERAHLLERDKDALQWNVKRLTSERNDVVNERIAMEEKILSLETIMADLKTECNTLRVSVSLTLTSPLTDFQFRFFKCVI